MILSRYLLVDTTRLKRTIKKIRRNSFYSSQYLQNKTFKFSNIKITANQISLITIQHSLFIKLTALSQEGQFELDRRIFKILIYCQIFICFHKVSQIRKEISKALNNQEHQENKVAYISKIIFLKSTIQRILILPKITIFTKQIYQIRVSTAVQISKS
ncbi:hypothetical protein TTHERM_000858039 (macronuclear) [Tetrahymena thermophila SB210]|uniref:Uncharacterized protein n=1 Tax=Tetrahymena thermophila (strain SB210) TaxID=312017 RepID=W7X619_TETTS|nr:hypothetical protein TTHERM_000858039 [Tetrahymena thermophila SB210]EWS72837.1 hypothetical protein TTHERM_000858039 [Tetrahymena thermophila SB210]|eukprot:XP_012654628.1 hypothetical protein TTHERM_000858039 [Tetrahymena thermophila SB210]